MSHYHRAYEGWKHSLPHAGHDVWHLKAKQTERHYRKHYAKKHGRQLLPWMLVGLLLLLLFAQRAHAQQPGSNIYSVTVQNGGTTLKRFAAPFSINCSTGMSCSVSGTTYTLTSTGGGAGGGFYQTVQNAGAALTQRAVLNFTAGITCSDDSVNSATVCTATAPVNADWNAASGLAQILNKPTLAATQASATSKWLNSYNASTGAFTATQPAFSDLSGNIATSQMNSGTGASSTTFWRGDGTWGTPAGSGLEYLGSTFCSSACTTTSVVNIAARDFIVIWIRVNGYSGSDVASIRFNGDTTAANYQSRWITFSNATTPVLASVNWTATALLPVGDSVQSTGRMSQFTCNNSATLVKTCHMEHGLQTTSGSFPTMTLGNGWWFNTANQITSVTMLTKGGASMTAGSGFAVFGKNF